MSIRGSLETFSLPELFQIIGSGNKSGRLTFNTKANKNNISQKATFELWFDSGNFVTLVNSLKYQFLIEMIQDKAWIESKKLVQAKFSCPTNKPFGTYIEEKKLLDRSQIDSLFLQQINETKKLFKVKSARFKFEEVDSKNKISKDGETFPWMEMTGKQKQVLELSLEAMRDFPNWSRFSEEMPPSNMGLQKLAPSCDIQLTHIEKYLWDMADGSISLQKIAKNKGVDLLTIQHTALSMIFSGLVEETPVISPKRSKLTAIDNKVFNNKQNNSVAVKTKKENRVSNSLINNLVSFLKDNF